MVSTVDDDDVSFAVVVIFVFVGMGSTVLCREVMVDTSACRCVVILEGAKATTLVDKTNRKVATRMGGLATMIMTIFKGSKLDSTKTQNPKNMCSHGRCFSCLMTMQVLLSFLRCLMTIHERTLFVCGVLTAMEFFSPWPVGRKNASGPSISWP